MFPSFALEISVRFTSSGVTPRLWEITYPEVVAMLQFTWYSFMWASPIISAVICPDIMAEAPMSAGLDTTLPNRVGINYHL